MVSYAMRTGTHHVLCPKALRHPRTPSRIRTCDPLIKSQLLYRLSYEGLTLVAQQTVMEPVIHWVAA